MKSKLWFPPAQKIEPMSNGILGLHDNISPVTRPLGMLSEASNVRRDRVTGISTRASRTSIGNRVGAGPILGLGVWYKYTAGALSKKLVSGALDKWKCYDPATNSWVTMDTSAVAGGITTGKPFNAVTFNDWLIITNLANEVMKYDGATTSTAVTDLGGTPPKSRYIATAYKRVFLDELPHLLRVSDSANAEDWITGDSTAIPINDKDGDEIKWYGLYNTHIVILKQYSIHELYGPELGRVSGDWSVYNIASVGTPNGKTVANVKGALLWLSDSKDYRGIVRWAGGKPEVISDPVKNTLDRINYAAIDKACATTDGTGLYLLALPLDVSTVNNAMVLYDANDGSWWVWENWAPTCFASYILDNRELVVMGDNDGYVYALNE